MSTTSLSVALVVAVVVSVFASLAPGVAFRPLRTVAIVSIYGLGIWLLIADRALVVVGTWCAMGLATGLLYYGYERWSLSRSEPGSQTGSGDEDRERASFSHLPMGLVAWPLMLPEVIEYSLAELGVIDSGTSE